jgi:hypothetical protein
MGCEKREAVLPPILNPFTIKPLDNSFMNPSFTKLLSAFGGEDSMGC